MLTVLLIGATVALVAILTLAYVLTRRDRRSAIAPASELQRKYGLYAENRPLIARYLRTARVLRRERKP